MPVQMGIAAAFAGPIAPNAHQVAEAEQPAERTAEEEPQDAAQPAAATAARRDIAIEKKRKAAENLVVTWKRRHGYLHEYYDTRTRSKRHCCKACKYFKASRNDALSLGTFDAMHLAAKNKGSYFSRHENDEHRRLWAMYQRDLGADSPMPGEKDADGRPVFGPAVAAPAPAHAPMDRIVTTQTERLEMLFRTAYSIIVKLGAARHMRLEISTQVANKANIVPGYYDNHHGFSEILKSIAAEIRCKQDARMEHPEAGLFSLLGDGSEEGRGDESDEAMVVRYYRHDRREYTNEFFALVNVDRADSRDKLSHDSQAIKQAYIHGLEARMGQRWKKWLVALGMDGASVNMGERKGVIALFQAILAWVKARHCGAHNLQLAVLDDHGEQQLLKDFEELLKATHARARLNSIDRTIDRLTDRSIDLLDQPTDRSTDRPIDRSIGRPTDRSIDLDRPTDRSTDRHRSTATTRPPDFITDPAPTPTSPGVIF